MQTLLMTTTTSVLGKHEVSLWTDGKMEIEEIADAPGADQIYERVTLDEIEQYRLYLLLTSKFSAKGGQ